MLEPYGCPVSLSEVLGTSKIKLWLGGFGFLFCWFVLFLNKKQDQSK